MHPSFFPHPGRPRPVRGVALAAVAALAVLTVGCGGQGNLNGKVTITEDGKTRSLAMGSVMVIASDNKPYYGEIKPDGSYQVSGVPAGNAKVVVNSPDPKLQDVVASRTAGRDGGDGSKAEPRPQVDRSK